MNDKKTKVFIRPAGGGVDPAAEAIFSAAGLQKRIAAAQEIYIKVNGIDFKPYCYTAPEVLESVIKRCRDAGARRVFVMENCTQSNFTRLVFKETGYTALCRRLGAKPLFLDEMPHARVRLPNMDDEVRIPRVVMKIADDPESFLYINVPKLKCHSMSTVTVGVKNQLGFVHQQDRIRDHNHRLHRKIADVYHVIRPAFTLVDALTAVFYGHYPPQGALGECLVRLDLLFGGEDTLAVDAVGARLLGYGVDEVEHLRLLREDGAGCGNLEDIEIDGPFNPPAEPYPFDIMNRFPPDVTIVRGAEMCCREGCRKNTETLLQTLYLDFGGGGGFAIVMGKGCDPAGVDALDMPVLLAGMCATDEHLDRLRRAGKKVYASYGCNNLARTAECLTKLSGVSFMRMMPHPYSSIYHLLAARLRRTHARLPGPLALLGIVK
ncbi:MAG: DUF362 domain-containing protein [bacterium]